MRTSGTILTDREENIITITNRGDLASVHIVNTYGDEMEDAIVFDSMESLDTFYKSCKNYITEAVEEEANVRSTII